MIKTVLASLTGSPRDKAVLETALDIARPFGARVEALHVRLDPQSALALALHQTSAEIERRENEQAQKARDNFERAAKDLASGKEAGGSVPDLKWRAVEGIDLLETIKLGRLSDLVVTAREHLVPGRVAELVMRIGRPVLVAPEKIVRDIGGHIAFAWKDGAEAARALTAAMPFLLKAKSVKLISIVENPLDKDAQKYALQAAEAAVAAHGVRAEGLLLDGQNDPGGAIKSAAYNANCTMIAMGAYGHSRLREYVFGGVTREMLKECALPVLMFH